MSGVFPVAKLPGNLPNLVVLEAAVSGVSPSGNTVGVVGQSVSQPGVWGTSNSGDGVLGTSDSGVGVKGTSNSQSGVVGRSTNADGVWADGGNHGVYGKSSNDKASGVYGINYGKGPGVTAASQYGPSLVATGYNGNLAGEFEGDVSATGEMKAATITSTGTVNAASLTTKGDVSAGNVLVSKDVILLNSAGADCAEDFDVRADEEKATPGTVLVISDTGALAVSREEYDSRIAGVVSGAGNLRPAIVLNRIDSERSRAPIALIGRTYCKVDATFAPIKPGDLLTTSPTAGHAMKVLDRTRAVGAILGKALGGIESGRGLIQILVSPR
ncbi:MAG: hypothetical protein OK455_06925 [Thaumarchaeota archaeon]|nr:hypothetical protein [Nitrososphaerota archaeon]